MIFTSRQLSGNYPPVIAPLWCTGHPSLLQLLNIRSSKRWCHLNESHSKDKNFANWRHSSDSCWPLLCHNFHGHTILIASTGRYVLISDICSITYCQPIFASVWPIKLSQESIFHIFWKKSVTENQIWWREELCLLIWASYSKKILEITSIFRKLLRGSVPHLWSES